MEKTYEVTWCEVKTTKTGKTLKSAQLKDEQGVVTDNVSIWADFQDFANIMPGSKVVGVLFKNDKGYFSLYPPKPVKTQNRGFGGGMGKELIKEKQKGITENIDRKEEGIKTSSTIRMATDCAIAERVGRNNLELTQEIGSLRERILYWRKWFIDNWDLPRGEYPDNPPDLENL